MRRPVSKAGTAWSVRRATVVARGYHVDDSASRANPGNRFALISPSGVITVGSDSSSRTTNTTGVLDAAPPAAAGNAWAPELRTMSSSRTGEANRNSAGNTITAGDRIVRKRRRAFVRA